MRLIAARTERTGLQQLFRDDQTGEHYVSITNRTYSSTQPIPQEKVEVWKRLLQGEVR